MQASSTMPFTVTERFRDLMRRSEDDLNLAEAALLLATDEYPGIDVNRYLRLLDGFATELQGRLSPTATFEDTLVGLNEFLFDEKGFSGNTDDYYDPRNSYLNEVLDRKLGIPITLSILYMEIGRRIGLSLEGLSFPGHFLVKTETDEGDIVLDPFLGGAVLSEEDLVQRLRDRFGEENTPTAPLAPLLQTAGKKEILLRVLRNLKVIYINNQNYQKALTTLDRILLVAPDLAEEVRDRGQLYERLECFGPALIDLRRYMSLNPADPDAGDLHRRIVELERMVSRLN
jgi:regulator of sirC expression with transglutaminase-like and TPR domain